MTAVPTFFDLQVNGYAGVDFNQDGLQADDLHRACERLDADGVGVAGERLGEQLGARAGYE